MKSRFFSLAAIVLILMASSVLAQEPAAEKLSVMIDVRSDFILPEKGENITAQSVNIWLQGKRFSGFLETDYKSKSHTLTIKPSFLFKQGPWYFLGGASTDSQGSDFVQAGAWFVDSFGKLNVLADLRNYWSISGKKDGYTDNLLQVMYPITGKLSIGTDLLYDHWWNGPGRNLYLVGPIIAYQLTKEINVYTRVSREWDVLGDKTQTVDRVRLAAMLIF